MKNCNDCGKNDWWFKTEAGMTVATCKNCKSQLRWPKKQKHKKSPGEPPACECGCAKFDREKAVLTIDILREPHYFMYNFKCKNCGAVIPDVTTKRSNLLYK